MPGSVKDISKWELGNQSRLVTDPRVWQRVSWILMIIITPILNIKQSDLTMGHQFKHLLVLTTFQAFVIKLKIENVRCLSPQGWWFLTKSFCQNHPDRFFTMDTRDSLYMKELQPLHLETTSGTATNLQQCLLRSLSETINICLSEMPILV